MKVTPVNLNRGGSVDLDNSQSESCQDEGLSIETMDLNDKTTNWPITEVAVSSCSSFQLKRTITHLDIKQFSTLIVRIGFDELQLFFFNHVL